MGRTAGAGARAPQRVHRRNFPAPSDKAHWSLQDLGRAAVTAGTQRNYDHGGRFFKAWLAADPAPYSVELLGQFLMDCMDAGVKYHTVNKVRCWAVQQEKLATGAAVVAQDGRITAAMCSYRNVSLENGWARTQPSTWAMLQPALCEGRLSPKAAALATLGYAFLLRWQELMDIVAGMSSITEYGRGFRLQLARSKTDVVGLGVALIFPRELFSDVLVMAVRGALATLKEFGGEEPASKAINDEFRALWGPRARFHSFRHGRCSDLLALGWGEETVMHAGRWESRRAMQLYVHAVSVTAPAGASPAPTKRRRRF